MVLEWKTCIRAGITVLILFLIIKYWDMAINLCGLGLSAAFPILLGCIIAYIANILMSLFESHFFPKSKKKVIKVIRRPICLIVTFLSIILVVFLLVNMILPELIACGEVLVNGIVETFTTLAKWAEQNVSLDILPQGSTLFNLGNMNWQEMIQKAINVLMTGVSGAMSSIVGIFSSVFGTVITIVVAIIFSIYLLFGKEKIAEGCTKFIKLYMGEKVYDKLMYVVKNLDASFHNFIVGQCLEAIILGLLCTIGMWILRLPYATMIGCLVGFTALIPLVGAFLGAIVGAFMIFTVSPIQAVIFLIFLVVLQQLEGNLIYPRVVGATIGLPGIWVFIAVTVGGGVLGIGGMLIAVPLTAAIYKMLKVDMDKRAKVKRIKV